MITAAISTNIAVNRKSNRREVMTENTYVWDKFVRLFHWSLVLLFIVSYLSGEDEHWIHVYSGYAIVTLLILRVIWGFIGTRHARFSDFIYSPAIVMQYIKSMLAGNPKRYLGHNPAGGVMVFALLATLSVVTFSGLKLYAVEEGKGPLAENISIALTSQAYADSDEHDDHEGREHDEEDEDEAEEFWEDIHEGAVNFMLLLIILHVVGVVVASRLHNESLIKAMITGDKEGSSG
jgi:cytochrome b